MYIPPYWLHVVRSRGFSVSSSVISPSFEEAQCAQLSLIALQFDGPIKEMLTSKEEWPLGKRGYTVLRFLQSFLFHYISAQRPVNLRDMQT